MILVDQESPNRDAKREKARTSGFLQVIRKDHLETSATSEIIRHAYRRRCRPAILAIRAVRRYLHSYFAVGAPVAPAASFA